jgi:hypothetical protein
LTTADGPLRVVCFKWKPSGAYRSQFGPQTVNVLKKMVGRHYPDPHEIVCITDDAKGIDSDVRVIPLWEDHAKVPSPWGPGNPSCYRRLKVFSREASEIIGPRFVCIDLDCVILDDLRPLWNRPEDFVIWGDTAKGTPYNGSMFLLRAGTRAQVWDDFDPATSPGIGKKLGYVGSDQAWIGARLGRMEHRWTAADGVVSYRNEVEPRGGHLPRGARVVMFHGKHDPWQVTMQGRHKWVRENYR